MRKIVLLLCLGFVFGCNDTSEPRTVTTETVKPRWETVKAHPEWTSYARESLWKHGQYLLTGELKDIKDFSVKSEVNREEFILFLLSLMVEKESYFKPSTEYKEKFKDRNGRNVISTGLFQISLESSNGSRYRCGMKSQADLKDPRKNIECSIKILNALVREDSRIAGKVSGSWKGGARYWSVLRDTRSDAYDFIKAKMRENF